MTRVREREREGRCFLKRYYSHRFPAHLIFNVKLLYCKLRQKNMTLKVIFFQLKNMNHENVSVYSLNLQELNYGIDKVVKACIFEKPERGKIVSI